MDGFRRFLPTTLLASAALALALGFGMLESGTVPRGSAVEAGVRVAATGTTGCAASSSKAKPVAPPSVPGGRAGSLMELFGPDPKVAAPKS